MDNLKTKYIQDLYAAETEKMAAVRRSVHEQDFPIHISAAEGRLLQILIRLGQVRTCVEIGTLGGYSSLWLADALPPDGHLWTCEHDDKRYELADRNLKDQHNITIVKGDAKETLPALTEQHGPFDMVFIDADKKSYLHYLDWAATAIRPGGLIAADDTLLKGAVYMQELPYRVRQSTKETLVEFNRRLADREKYDGILWPTAAGLTIAIKK